MTAGVFDTPSGGWPVISRRGYNTYDPNRDTPRTAYWRSGGAVAGLVLAGFAAVVGGAVYPMAWATTAGGVRSLVLAIAAVLAALAGVTLVAAWQDHRAAQRQQRLAAGLAAEMHTMQEAVARAAVSGRQQLAELEDLPRRLLSALERHEHHQAELLMALREEVRHAAAGLDKRLTALEQAQPVGRIEDGQLDEDERYLAGYADGLAGRTLGEGSVVPLNGRNGHRHR